MGKRKAPTASTTDPSLFGLPETMGHLASADRYRVINAAERLTFDEDVAKGAMLPGGLGWLSPASRRPYLIKAMETLGRPLPPVPQGTA